MYILPWIEDDVPPNCFRALNGEVVPLDRQRATLLAGSDHDSMSMLRGTNLSWGCRWYALYEVDGRYVFTVGYGMWFSNREVSRYDVPRILRDFFSWNEVTEHGRRFLQSVGTNPYA